MIDFKYAVFDADGTLFDSMQMWGSFASDFVKSYSMVPKPDLDSAVAMLGYDAASRLLKKDYFHHLSCEQIKNMMNEHIVDFYENRVELKEGASDFLRALSQRGVKLAVATATDREIIKKALKNCRVSEFFGAVVSCNDIGKAKKDSARVFEVAAEMLGGSKEEAVIFEDALHAIKTAKRDGFRCFGLFDELSKGDREEMQKICEFYFDSWKQAKEKIL